MLENGSVMASGCPQYVHAVRLAVQVRAGRLRVQAPGVRNETIEGVHDMRVAARRLNAALKEYRRALKPAAHRRFSVRIQGVRKALGAARELDVCLQIVATHAKGQGKPAGLARIEACLRNRRAAEREAVHGAVDAVDCRPFEEELRRVVATAAPPPGVCLLAQARKSLRRRHDKMLKAHEAWVDDSSAERLHRVRIALKKLRYVCEIFGPLHGDGFRVYMKELKAAQDVLGLWNDHRVLVEYARAFAEDAKATARPAMLQVVAMLDEAQAGPAEAFIPLSRSFFAEKNIRRAEALLADPAATCCDHG